MPRSKKEAIAAGVKIAETQHNMKRRIISREQCLKLNRLVEEIVNRADF